MKVLAGLRYGGREYASDNHYNALQRLIAEYDDEYDFKKVEQSSKYLQKKAI